MNLIHPIEQISLLALIDAVIYLKNQSSRAQN